MNHLKKTINIPAIKKGTPSKQKKSIPLLIVSILLVIMGMILIVCISTWAVIESIGSQRLYDNVRTIPHNQVGLLLGTSASLKDGRSNLFFLYRIRAATELFRAQKIQKIIVSGDNKHRSYNEPEQMQQALLDAGVPHEDIILDYAGLRTLDSVIRAKKVFGQKNITIISQPFHLRRALFIARYNDIDAIGYAAKDVPVGRAPRVYLREIGARIKAVFDTIRGTQPTFLGDMIPI